MSEIVKHWIDGEWTGSGTVSESVNPATGAVLGQWADGGEAEARAAIAALARGWGCRAVDVETTEELEQEFKTALGADTTTVIVVRTQPQKAML